MKAGQVAVFPLRLVRDSIRARSQNKHTVTDYRLCERFGYIRGERMTPAVVFSGQDLSYVHCGAHPLVGCVEMSYYTRWRMVGFCYINNIGEHVYPA